MAKFGASAARINAGALARLSAQIDGLSAAALAKADARSLASVRRRFEPAAKRAIRETYNVRASDLSGKFQVRSGADGGGEFMALHVWTQKLPLMSFGGRWGGRKTAGATAQIQSETRKVYGSSFIAMIDGKRRLVARQFSRDSTSPSGRDPRNKLRTLMGPSAWQMVMGNGDATAARLAREMNEYRGSELIRQLQLARKRKR